MATHKSAKKRIRQTARRTLVNGARRSRVRTFVRKVEEAIESGDREMAESAMQNAMPEMHRSVLHGILHKNTAARKISRLTKRINNL
ncbi:MAG: 30S ribosomal protein S20 [Alphaproteobacteria bacterium MarineAlpha10_Bin3]|jgi:small subunit ribosomal protein S20|nr:MAG: 30S ribosomal protein S20 [Alphaproteobacteria bacterium MarineAlpha10_Bin3]PPR74091.1 MAG: 30S ribosomal protein S20 [Alphaproteobacteria bacterium MarineAlpha4_Bin1]